MPKLLEIAELGNPILRKKSETVEDVKDPKIQNLIDDMILTTSKVNGVGLSAPQISRPIRVFIMASYPNERYPKAPEMEPLALINPEIVSKSEDIEKDWEGCLSIPGIRGFVPRHKNIHVTYTDRYGNAVETTFKNFLARIFQHEFDHLNGIVFLDRLESSKDIITDREYIKLFQ